jgi:hypothetical protein
MPMRGAVPRTLRTAVLGTLLAGSAGGCTASGTGPDGAAARTLSGVIVNGPPADAGWPGGGGTLAFRVDLDAPSAERLRTQEVFVRVERETPFRVRSGARLVPGTLADLRAGAEVRVAHTSAMLRSDPPQVIATDVEVRPAAP